MNNSNYIDQTTNALEAFIDRKEELKRTAPLRYLFWESTLRCNLSCLHCGSDCVRDDASQVNEVEPEHIRRELRSIAQHYPPEKCTFAIIGGEPLLRDDIVNVGAYAAELGFNWGITTNGMLLSREMIKRLKKAQLRTLSVSLDGIAADHDKLRNCKGSHKVVTTAIRNLFEDRFFRKFDVICTVSRINIDHLEAFVEDMIRLQVTAIRFTPVFSRGRAGRNSDLMLAKDDYRKMLTFVKEGRVKRNNIKIYLSEEGYWGPEWECVVRDQFHYCGSGIMIGSILHDGRVTGCPSVSRNFIEGTIKESAFIDLWKSGFTRYRQGRKQAFADHCGACEHWVLCEGGGFHLLDQDNVSGGFCCLDKISQRGDKNERL